MYTIGNVKHGGGKGSMVWGYFSGFSGFSGLGPLYLIEDKMEKYTYY